MIMSLRYYMNYKVNFTCFFLSFPIWLLETLKLHIRLIFEAAIISTGQHWSRRCLRCVLQGCWLTNSCPVLVEYCSREINSLVLRVFFHEQRKALCWESQALPLESSWWWGGTGREPTAAMQSLLHIHHSCQWFACPLNPQPPGTKPDRLGLGKSGENVQSVFQWTAMQERNGCYCCMTMRGGRSDKGERFFFFFFL